jgi:electron transfer flavoprotein alpha/beta subunit
MKIAVCLKEVINTNLNLGYGWISDSLFQKGLSSCLNPQDGYALAEALKIKKEDPSTEVILISLGPESAETYLREGLAQGADKAVRIRLEPEYDRCLLTPYQKSKILAGALSTLKADLILGGSASLDNASGLVMPLIAARLEIPGICEATSIMPANDHKSVTVIRNLGKGVREELTSTLPAVLSIANSKATLPYAALDKVLAAAESEMSHLSLADLGITPSELKNEPVQVSGISFPRPRTKPAPLDSSLPAYYRILALLEGGIRRRKGNIMKGNTDELVDHLYQMLVDQAATEKRG